MYIRNDIFPIRTWLRIFRVPDLDPDSIHVILANLEIIKKLESIKRKNLPTISHFLFYTYSTIHTVLQSRIFMPKSINKTIIYLLFHSCRIHNTALQYFTLIRISYSLTDNLGRDWHFDGDCSSFNMGTVDRYRPSATNTVPTTYQEYVEKLGYMRMY